MQNNWNEDSTIETFSSLIRLAKIQKVDNTLGWLENQEQEALEYTVDRSVNMDGVLTLGPGSCRNLISRCICICLKLCFFCLLCTARGQTRAVVTIDKQAPRTAVPQPHRTVFINRHVCCWVRGNHVQFSCRKEQESSAVMKNYNGKVIMLSKRYFK